MKCVLAMCKRRFLAGLVHVTKIYLGKDEPKYNLIVRITCMCWLRLSLTAYKLHSGVLNNRHK